MLARLNGLAAAAAAAASVLAFQTRGATYSIHVTLVPRPPILAAIFPAAGRRRGVSVVVTVGAVFQGTIGGPFVADRYEEWIIAFERQNALELVALYFAWKGSFASRILLLPFWRLCCFLMFTNITVQSTRWPLNTVGKTSE